MENKKYVSLWCKKKKKSNDFVTVQVIWNSGIAVYFRYKHKNKKQVNNKIISSQESNRVENSQHRNNYLR